MIKTKIISEIVGSPEEHVNTTMGLLLDKIKESKQLTVTSEKKFEAQKIPEKPLFSAFIEYEAEFEELQKLIDFCFDFMPSSIEILEPAEIRLKAESSADLFNELLARLHQNDLFLRNLIAEMKLLKDKLGQK
ncbi:MAG: hypothetical protein ABIB47_04085 [Candidatus Woesearchaeota archaeon]